MVSAIVLDALLVLILLMMIPLGFLRGGLREVSTSAGLLLGILLAGEWAGSWGGWVADRTGADTGLSRFVVSLLVVVLTTALIGYGGSAAFAYRPGPGGRMYGAFLAFLNGTVFAGFLINTVVRDVYDGALPDAVKSAFVSRSLSVGFEWVLLVAALGILAATVFGMLVRERSEEEIPFSVGQYGPPRPDPLQQTQKTAAVPLNEPRSVNPEPPREIRPSSPVRIKEVRHWEDQPETSTQGQRDYAGGWRQTWPEPPGSATPLPWEQQRTPKRAPSAPPKSQQKPKSQRDVLRDWMKDESSRDDQ